MTTPFASLSLDLDNLWSYQRIHGDAGWEDRRSYLAALMPPLLDLLDEIPCRITFFVVGADAAAPENGPTLRSITERGHEVGNHSFQHECWLHLYSREQLEGEIAAAEEAIAAACGMRPVGFRGPGYSWSPALLEILSARGYRYDASTLPTYLGPLARAYYLAHTRLTREQRDQRRALFGAFSDGFRPLRPYLWQLASGRRLLEIPVTTLPVLKLPFHMSYLIYLSRFSRPLMEGYLRLALAVCRRLGVMPSFLLHPLDVLGADQVPELTFFPGMDVPGTTKRALVRDVLRTMARQFALVPMSVHAERELAREPRTVPAPPPSRRAVEAAPRTARTPTLEGR